MRRSVTVLTLAAVVVLVAVTSVLAAPPAQPRNFTVPLSGADEVPVVDTRARGVAIFQLSADGTELSYRLIASNIEDITQAHIHCCAGPEGTAPPAVFLYPDAAPGILIPGRHSGTLATGTITDSDLINELAGMTVADLVDEIVAGTTYVNVHTLANPPGEIRGQLP